MLSVLDFQPVHVANEVARNVAATDLWPQVSPFAEWPRCLDAKVERTVHSAGKRPAYRILLDGIETHPEASEPRTTICRPYVDVSDVLLGSVSPMSQSEVVSANQISLVNCQHGISSLASLVKQAIFRVFR